MNELTIQQNIEHKIFTIRGVQVMIDRDLAELYGVETRALKQAVKRNIGRFPPDFMFELDDMEIESMVSQSVIPSKKHLGGAKPYAFTEQGVASLSGVLNSQTAIDINISILRAFVKMRKFLMDNADVFKRLELVEKRQVSYEIKTDEKFEILFNAIESKSIAPKQGVFFDGQIFDAYILISDLLKKAKNSIIL
ncbi:MAG: ORF6N domain-containing protein, partial [Wolinella sp.]